MSDTTIGNETTEETYNRLFKRSCRMTWAAFQAKYNKPRPESPAPVAKVSVSREDVEGMLVIVLGCPDRKGAVTYLVTQLRAWGINITKAKARGIEVIE